MHVTLTHLCGAAIAITMLAACGGDATSPPGPPAKMQLVSSASITANVGDTIAAPIIVDVRDAAGRGVPNVPVVAWGVVGIPLTDGKTYSVVAVDSIVPTDAAGRATIRMIAPTAAADTGTIYVQLGQSAGTPSNFVGLTIHIATKPGAFAQLIPHRAQRFSGSTFAVDSLFTAADRYGNVLSGPAAQVTASNAWTVSGNTLTPPSATYVGTTVVTATSGSVTATDSVSVVDDFRKYHWTMQYKCAATADQVAAGAADSVIAFGTNGSAYYPGDAGYQGIVVSANVPQPAVEFRFTGTFTSYRNGVATSSSDIMGGNPYGWQVYFQRPDAVGMGLDTYARTLARVPGTLPGFASPTAWCTGTTIQGVTLQAY